MAPRRARFYSYGTDEQCAEARKFIEDAGVLLDLRDMSVKPLTEEELNNLIGHLDINHFLNPASPSYSRHGLDRRSKVRAEVIKLMAQDYTLIRRPIIQSPRLLTVGCDKRKISEMLQLNSNGSESSRPDVMKIRNDVPQSREDREEPYAAGK
jgi:arsenate reductase-like glutaredoxin family protein